MSKASRKQIKITADLLATAQHHLGEIGQPYILIIEGIPTLFSNVHQTHAEAILDRQWRLKEKISELTIEATAEKLTAIPPQDGSASSIA